MKTSLPDVKLAFKALTAVDTWTPGRYSAPDGQIFFEPGIEYRLSFWNDDVLDVSHLTLDPLVVLSSDLENLARDDRIRIDIC